MNASNENDADIKNETVNNHQKRKANVMEDTSETTSKVSKRFKSLKKAIQDLLHWKPSTSSTDKALNSPSNILSSEGCIAQTLTISNQHATLLLTSQNNNACEEKRDSSGSNKEKKEVKSILKLSLVPFHKETLGSNPVMASNDTLKPELKVLESNPKASNQIISFLQSYNFHLKSESGAEYSYYNATPSPSQVSRLSNRVCSDAARAGSMNVELISPASDRQIKRAMPSNSTSLIEETSEMYNLVVKPYIQSIVDGRSLDWIFNIISGEKEKERLLLDHKSFIINIDTKWRSHPDTFKTPREDWYQHSSVGDLYCLGIIKQKSVATLRDLTKDHIPMLKAMKQEGLDIIDKTYGVKSDQMRVFVHYHPQFYHFHVHFTRLHNEIGSQVERGHLVSDIIQNLELDGDYYAKRTISYKMNITSPLYLLIKQEQQQKSQCGVSM